MINQRTIWFRSLLAGALLGGLVGGFMMYVAWQHNAQGEIHDGATVHWLYWFVIGLSWLVPVALVSGLITCVVWTIAEWFRPNSRHDANSAVPGDAAKRRA